MIKEKLRKALSDAVEYYNGGLSANDAVIKSASDHDLTIDQTDRVVESFNTAKTINFFDKHAEDRAGKFDLADKSQITLKLFGKESREKKASVAPSDLDSFPGSFYASEPDTSANRKNIFREKKANLLDALSKVAEEKWAHGYSDKTFQDMASDAYTTIKSAEADIDSALGTIDSYLLTATNDLVRDLTSNYDDVADDRVNLFKIACPHTIVTRQLEKFSPMLKEATGGKYRKMNVIDTSSIDNLLKEADDIAEIVKQREIYRQKKAEFRAKAEKIKEAMLKDPSLSDIISKDKEILLHMPAKSAGSIDSDSVIDSFLAIQSRKDNNEAIRDEERGSILADLLSSDPILKDADPRQISAIYKSIIASSPRVSLNKEVVRSVLRGAINSIAVSPNDMKVLTDVDKGINLAYSPYTQSATAANE